MLGFVFKNVYSFLRNILNMQYNHDWDLQEE